MKRTSTLTRLARTGAVAVALLLSGQVRAAVTLTALSGTGGTGSEGYPSLVDGKPSTKLGTTAFTDDTPYAYVIIKASQPIVPTDYFLVTGNDTKKHPERNWQDWTIYAANFDSDSEAVEDAQWTEIDSRQGEMLPTANYAGVDYTFNKADGTTAYQYFMIKITAAVNGASNVWIQMAEFGFGKSEPFLNSTPAACTALAGTRYNNDSEGLPKLFDGNNGSKWCTDIKTSANWGKDGNGAYAIFKTSRPIAPTYCKLVTGGDTQWYGGRNWKDYRIYGTAETDESKLTRDADIWVLIDEEHATSETLPARNTYAVYMPISEQSTEKYQYFKLEIASTQGDGILQMSEMALGDAGQFNSDKADMLQTAQNAVDTEKTFQKTLKDNYQAALANLEASEDVFTAKKYSDEIESMKSGINSSINAYTTLNDEVEKLRNHYDNHDCITGEGRTIVGNYLNENVAPNDTYPNGSYPYIVANALLDVAGTETEKVFVNSLTEQYASDITEGAIASTYTVLDGTQGNAGEGLDKLFDGDGGSKWCTSNNASVYAIFKSSEAIKPTYYKLITGNDTGWNGGRNWKTWKIYGANFTDDSEATRNAEGWTLIDEKANIGTDQLPAANSTDAYFYLSKPSNTAYQYYRIEVEALVNGTTQQMGDFEFANEANRIIKRNEAYEELAAYDLNVKASKSLIEEYKSELATLKTSATIKEVVANISTLKGTQEKIAQNVTLYSNYNTAYTTLTDNASAFEKYTKLSAWIEAYSTQNEAPGATFLRGSHDYIWENCLLDDEGIKKETEYLNSMNKAVAGDGSTTLFIVLDGNGKYKDEENWARLVDNDYNTKWGCNFSNDNLPYVIFRSLNPVNPYFYTLNTGGDAQGYPGRNWKTWKIYGANFDNDGEATVDAEGWVLVDEKTEIGQNRLKPLNNTASYFGFSSETTVPYTYYKVVVEQAYSGGAQQMQELHFGTNEEFDKVKEQYKNEVADFTADYTCEQRLLDKYDALLNDIDECVNMEVLFRTYDELKNLQDSIKLSAASYTKYMDAVKELRDFVTANPDVKGNARDLVDTYLGEQAVEPSDVLPNGSYAYIIGECLLGDSLLNEEIDFLALLKKNMVAEGYVEGTEITALVSDPSLAKGGEGWSDKAYTYGTYYGMSAGEFCNDKRTYDMHQTLTGLKNGLYEVRINAAFRPNSDVTSTNYRAIVYANDAQIFAPAVRDDMVKVEDAVDGENCYITGNLADNLIKDENGDSLGYVVWGVQGSCMAFKAGRYENVLMAEVTDGTLTFGVRNDGTPAKDLGLGDWTAIGNVRIFYQGGTGTYDGYNRALTCQDKRVKVLCQYVGDDLQNFRQKPNFSKAARLKALEALTMVGGSGEEGSIESYKSAQAKLSALCDVINAEKDAYVNANDGTVKVYNKWMAEKNMTKEDIQKVEDDIAVVTDGLLGGTFTADEALAAKNTLYAQWPDYLQVTNAESMGYTEDAPFSYVLTATNAHPYVLASGIYEKLDSTQNILKLEYKSTAELTGGKFYFGTPAIVTTQALDVDPLAAQSDWKTIYFYIDPALANWSFGDLEDVLRYDLTTEMGEGTVINLRHMQFITEKQMQAEGGEATYPTAIDTVNSQTTTSVKGIYNLSGQRVSRAQKGIYIINGRKVLVK